MYEEMNKGMTSVVIVPVNKDVVSDCTESHVSGEISLGEPVWNGEAFVGARGNLLFFEWVDGMDGGMPFFLLDATNGNKVYADSAYVGWDKNVKQSPFDRMSVISAQDGSISLKYSRVEAYDCDLHLPAERNECWEKIRTQAGLGNREMPVCSGYGQIHNHYASAVAYPVQVFLRPEPTRRIIAGPVRCWPVD
jgi:hypothetical protein